MDVSELLRAQLDLPGTRPGRVSSPRSGLPSHAACSLQHGQQIKTAPKDLLKQRGLQGGRAGRQPPVLRLAGTYNLMQPAISRQLKDRKIRTLEARAPDVIATGNIGCMMQIGGGTDVPVVHTVELLDWATGGPRARRP